jgi:hypothetical protein
LEDRALPSGAAWTTFAHDSQHTGLSQVPSQPLNAIAWQTPVDLHPHYGGGLLLTHYGSPLITDANTVLLGVKTNEFDGFRVEAHSGVDGSLLWMQPTDYTLPPHSWIPGYNIALTPTNRLYFPGAGGTLYYIDHPDQPGATIDGQVAYYGIGNYNHGLDGTVYINTPLTVDSAGNVYFGVRVTGANSLNLRSGIARVAPDGTGTWLAVATAVNDNGIDHVLTNCAPALSNDESTLYYAVTAGNYQRGYLVAADPATLQTIAQVAPKDPKNGANAELPDDGTASPMVGPDGQVYFGVFAASGVNTHSRGWMLHFTPDLQQLQVPGAFGWDNTASVVPSSMVASYHGSSSYLLMTKYNNYAGAGGDGVNKIAILDPNDSQVDPITGVNVMAEVLTIAGQTRDPDFPNFPNAVREWCINDAVVDPFTGSVLANSEDGGLYRWDLNTNTFTESIQLTAATGEAYTPTMIGVDGTAYAINNAQLYAVRTSASSPGFSVLKASTPEGLALSSLGSLATISSRVETDQWPHEEVGSAAASPGRESAEARSESAASHSTLSAAEHEAPVVPFSAIDRASAVDPLSSELV